MRLKELEILVNELKKSLETHLQESGEIRTDLKWLKRAFWTLAAGGVTFNLTFVMAVLNRAWK